MEKSQKINVEKEGVPCWKWYHSVIVYGFLLVFFSNFVPKMHRFWDISLVSIPRPWNPDYWSLKVIENYIIRSSMHDFLLTFHSSHQPILYRFRDKQRFLSKITNFSHTHVFNAPAKGVPLELGIGTEVRRN